MENISISRTDIEKNISRANIIKKISISEEDKSNIGKTDKLDKNKAEKIK